MGHTNSLKTLNEVSGFLQNAEAGDTNAASNLPLESIEDFSTAPISFEETHAIILERTRDLFALTARYNRHSEEYLEACSYLDKSIRVLGSACITRFVVEKPGMTVLSKLSDLSTKYLFGMASFNFRKLNAAIEDEMQDQGQFSMSLMNMLLRYQQTLDRLRATEAKIYKINAGEIDYGDYYEKAWAFSKKTAYRASDKRKPEEIIYRETTAFPVISEAIRELTQEPEPEQIPEAKKDEIHEEEPPALPALPPAEPADLDSKSPEIIEPESVTKNAPKPFPPERYMTIDFGEGTEPLYLTVENAKAILADTAYCDEHPDLKIALLNFVLHADSS